MNLWKLKTQILKRMQIVSNIKNYLHQKKKKKNEAINYYREYFLRVANKY